MLKRLQRMWKLSRKDPDKLDLLLQAPDVVIDELRDADDAEVKGEFFAEATSADYKDFQDEQSGMKAWFDRIKNL